MLVKGNISSGGRVWDRLSYILNAALLLAMLFGLFTCSKEEEPKGAQGVYDVDPIFEPYVQQFISEAAKRGHAIDFSDTGLKIELSDRQLEFAGGFCYLNQHHVVINKTVWQEGFEDYKTRLIFHELGHCELDRRHRNDRFSNNVWKSLMRGDPLNPAERQIPVPFVGFRKDYYIDELFDENTADPSWANASFNYEEVQSSNKAIKYDADSLQRYFQGLDVPLSKYDIEIHFKLNKTPTQSTTLTWTTDQFKYTLTFYAENLYTVDAEKAGSGLFLYRAMNSANISGREVDKITVRQHEGFEKIFLNDQFIFHVDPMPGPLQSVRFESKEFQTNNFDLNLEIHSVVISEIL